MKEYTPRKNQAKKIILCTCLFSIGYAILRYHVVGPVLWKEIPLYTLNKGIALSAFILLIFNFSLGPLKKMGVHIPNEFLASRKLIGLTGFSFAFVHVLISAILFNSSLYEKFFHLDGTFRLTTSLSMLGGIFAFVILFGHILSFLKQQNKGQKIISARNLLLLAMLLSFSHIFFMGYESWITPDKWNGSLPPISLIGCVFFLFGFAINLFGRR